jgi:hypothetical protein
MMNSMKNMFRKCWICSHQGKPESTDGADCAAGVVLNKGRDTRQFAQALRERDQAEQRRRSDRQRPERIEPAAPNPDAWKNSLLGRHPMIETDAIVRVAETGAERLW